MMMMPPMVGTPVFFTLKGSVLASRWVSSMRRSFILRMNQLPNQTEMTRARMAAVTALTVT